MLLNVSGLSKSFTGPDGAVPVLQGVDLTLEAGQSLALTGESGSGKSTLLHLVGGLDSFDGGEIRIDGYSLAGVTETGRAALRRSTVGLIFQQFNLIPSLDVASNIAFQARLAGRHDPARCAALAQDLGLDAQLSKYPEHLSGGQQQRVAIARTLAAQPRLVLADEPTGNLDEATADAVMTQLLSLVSRTGAALLMVTHSPRLAARLDRRLHLSAGRLS